MPQRVLNHWRAFNECQFGTGRERRRAMKYFLALVFHAVLIFPFCGVAQTNTHTPFLTLKEAIDAALLNNRALQIQRINPEIARMTLQASWGYYDPFFAT